MWQFIYPIFGDKNLDLGLFLLIVLICSGIHEFAHAWTGYKCGDESVKDRVSINPVKHIGFFPTFLMPCLIYYLSDGNFIFGTAKPVPINSEQLNRRGRDTFFVALAGAKANLFIVFLLFIVMIISKFFVASHVFRSTVLCNIIYNCVFINLLLAFIAIFPFPPTDGFKAIRGFLPVWKRFFFVLDILGIVAILFIFHYYPEVIYKLFLFIRDDAWQFIWECYVKFPV